jgi:hypothetical protein
MEIWLDVGSYDSREMPARELYSGMGVARPEAVMPPRRLGEPGREKPVKAPKVKAGLVGVPLRFGGRYDAGGGPMGVSPWLRGGVTPRELPVEPNEAPTNPMGERVDEVGEAVADVYVVYDGGAEGVDSLVE